MARSIATRTFHIVLLSTLLSLCLSLGFAWWGLENLELTMLEAENRTEVEYFEKYGDKTVPQRINTAQLISFYLPNGYDAERELPLIFQGLPVPFQGEVELFETDYIVVTHALPEGRFYVAKNLQLFEEREEALVITLLILAAVICIIALILALLAARNISKPIVRLTTQLKELDTNTSSARIDNEYVDSELREISTAVNRYLQSMEESIKRERSLISMASHELKTPVSVILGAAHVMEAREELKTKDAVTLNRIIDAAQDMSANIGALLNLARQSKESEVESFLWSEMMESIHLGYQMQNVNFAGRLQFDLSSDSDEIIANRALVKMLLHNLINNALNYTQGNVFVHLDNKILTVSDEGGNHAIDSENLSPPSSGLGLFIVDQICKQLQWHYHIIPSSQGTCVEVNYV